MKVLSATICVLAAAACMQYVSAEPKHDTQSETSTLPQTNPSAIFSQESTIDDYLEYAFLHNRSLRALNAKQHAAEEHVNQTTYLPDPQLSAEYMFEQNDMQYMLGIRQMIPGFGKLRLRKNIAASNASSIGHDYEAMRLMVFENTIKAFYNYHYIGRAISVTEENVALLSDLEKVLLASYKATRTRYSDLLKVQVEKDRLLDRLAGFRDMRSVKSARLCAILDLPTTLLLPWPKTARSATTTLSADVLMDMLETLNPELKAQDSTIDALDNAVKLAKKQYTPDFTIGAGFMAMPETDDGTEPTDVSVMIGISLPVWWGRYASAEREAVLKHESAVHHRRQMQNDLQLELKEALFDLRDAERRISLYEESLIPKAEQAFKVARKEFTGGTTTFMTLIDAQRTLFDFSLMLERALADREIALGEIGCCVGKYNIETNAVNNGREK